MKAQSKVIWSRHPFLTVPAILTAGHHVSAIRGSLGSFGLLCTCPDMRLMSAGGGMTTRQLACQPLPELKQSSTSRSKSEGRRRRTFSEAQPHPGFKEGVDKILALLDDTEAIWEVWL